jgi:hypothetical protein
MVISRQRLERLCLFNYIKYQVLGYSFIEQGSSSTFTAEGTIYTPSFTGLTPSPVSVGRGLVPFDESATGVITTAEQSSRVQVSGPSSYSIDYFLARIINPNVVPTNIDYYWNYISVLDGWPDRIPPELPLVVIDIDSSKRSGFQLGPGHLQSRNCSIYIFANDKAEREDIEETLYDALYNKTIPFIDFSSGEYLNYDGTFNTSFSSAVISGVGRLEFLNVAARKLEFASDWSDLNKYRSSITFILQSFVQ